VKGIKVIIAAAVVVASAFSLTAGVADSGRCEAGDNNEGAAGASVANQGDPVGRNGWAAVCNDGSVVPIGGHVEVGGDLNEGEEGYVHVDGDAGNNSTHKCADGFVRMEADSSGRNDWYSGDSGNKNNQSEKKTAQQVVEDTIEDCQ
jgi:hypothetical protein